MTQPDSPLEDNPPAPKSRIVLFVAVAFAALLLALTVFIAVVVLARGSTKDAQVAPSPSAIPATYNETQVAECKVRSNISAWSKLADDGSVGGGEKGITSPSILLTTSSNSVKWEVSKPSVLVCHYDVTYAKVVHTATGVTITDRHDDAKEIFKTPDTYTAPEGYEIVSFTVYGLDTDQPNGIGVS